MIVIRSIGFSPDKGVPIDEEDNRRSEEACCVLSRQVVGNLLKEDADELEEGEEEDMGDDQEKEEDQTFLHGSLPRVAMATVTAGLRCPPETPPLTRTPSITPSPHLGESQCCYFIKSYP